MTNPRPPQQDAKHERWAENERPHPQTTPVATEEPLQIRLHDQPFAVVMRTPGADLDLALGLLYSERLIKKDPDLVQARHCFDVPLAHRGNVVEVTGSGIAAAKSELRRRNLISSSACGVCGRETIDDLTQHAEPIVADQLMTAEVIRQLPHKLRQYQAGFAATGCTHAAALFDTAGKIVDIREDVGRHNAVDKLIGAAFRRRHLPLRDRGLFVSGRVSFEIMQKARRAGIPWVAAISAPTSLAIDLAQQGGQCLIGFVRDQQFNVYAGSARLEPDAPQ